jgi:hypothetical protein
MGLHFSQAFHGRGKRRPYGKNPSLAREVNRAMAAANSELDGLRPDLHADSVAGVGPGGVNDSIGARG